MAPMLVHLPQSATFVYWSIAVINTLPCIPAGATSYTLVIANPPTAVVGYAVGGMNWALSKSLSGVHGSAVTACAVLEGGATTWALSADAHGRLMCHNLSKHLSVAAQALTSFASGCARTDPR